MSKSLNCAVGGVGVGRLEPIGPACGMLKICDAVVIGAENPGMLGSCNINKNDKRIVIVVFLYPQQLQLYP